MAAESKIQKFVDSFPKIEVDDLLELFRNLRQETINTETQNSNSCEIVPCLNILSLIVDYMREGNADNAIDKFVLNVSARVGVQFLGNAIVCHIENQKILWKNSQFLRQFLRHDDYKMKNYVCMIYYNLIFPDYAEEFRKQVLADDVVMEALLMEATEGLSEFPQYIIEKFLQYNLYDSLMKDDLITKYKTFIFDVLCSLINKQDENDFSFDKIHIDNICDKYIQHTEVILNGQKSKSNDGLKETKEPNSMNTEINEAQTTSNAGSINSNDDLMFNPIVRGPDRSKSKVNFKYDPRMTVKLLTTLCSLTSCEVYNRIISDNTPLVINTIYVLRAIKMSEEDTDKKVVEHDVKNGDIGSENKVSEINSNEALTGFKAELIRLLGNLCWKHKKNQDLLRENRAIELILESCKLDEKNPFIREWAIMAVRNLCDNNHKNQEFINSMKMITEADIVAATQRMALIPDTIQSNT